MPKELVLRGVPASIARDGWWLASETTEPLGACTGAASPRNAAELRPSWVAGMAFLMGLGDVLFWGFLPGVSVIIFAWAIFGIALALRPPERRVHQPMALLFLASLPMFEHAQALSVAFLAAGLVGAVAWLRIAPGRERALLAKAALHLAASVPYKGIIDLGCVLRGVANGPASRSLPLWRSAPQLWRNWAFPFGGTLVLSVLLINANPVLERALLQALQIDIDLFTIMKRIIFWLGLGLLIWPFLIATSPSPAITTKAARTRIGLGLNAGSVLRALILFNLFLVVQSIMDVSILLVGAHLPDGMSHASYAHRGAYPLLITAMLAGAFALAAQPFLAEHRALKPLMLLWLVQNVLLTVSALLRLDLYVDAYGLTYLRLYAAIWMGVVALGLAMVAWQIMRGHRSQWLLLRTAVLGVGVLYICTFINFAAIVAADFMDRTSTLRFHATPDWHYLCSLGPTASKSIAQGMENRKAQWAPEWVHNCVNPQPSVMNWREWDFRTVRINGYLAARQGL